MSADDDIDEEAKEEAMAFIRDFPGENAYQVLGLEPNASEKEITEAKRKALFRNKRGNGLNPTEEMKRSMRLACDASRLLTNPKCRAAYDKLLQTIDPESPSQHGSTGHEKQAEQEANNFSPAQELLLDQEFEKVFLEWDLLKQRGFDCEQYYYSRGNQMKTFLGARIHGIPVVETINFPGFVVYFNRGLACQKTFNLIIVGLAGGSVSLVIEIAMMIIGVLVAASIFAANLSPKEIGVWCPRARRVLLFAEFILVCVFLAIATAESVSTGVLFLVGLTNIWTSLFLWYSNSVAEESVSSDSSLNDRLHAEEYAKNQLEQPMKTAPLRAAVQVGLMKFGRFTVSANLQFLTDSAKNGVFMRFIINVSSLFAFLALGIGLAIDIIGICCSRSIACLSMIFLAGVVVFTQDLFTECTKCFVDYRWKHIQKMSVHDVGQYFSELVFLFELQQVAREGRWVLRKNEWKEFWCGKFAQKHARNRNAGAGITPEEVKCESAGSDYPKGLRRFCFKDCCGKKFSQKGTSGQNAGVGSTRKDGGFAGDAGVQEEISIPVDAPNINLAFAGDAGVQEETNIAVDATNINLANNINLEEKYSHEHELQQDLERPQSNSNSGVTSKTDNEKDGLQQVQPQSNVNSDATSKTVDDPIESNPTGQQVEPQFKSKANSDATSKTIGFPAKSISNAQSDEESPESNSAMQSNKNYDAASSTPENSVELSNSTMQSKEELCGSQVCTDDQDANSNTAVPESNPNMKVAVVGGNESNSAEQSTAENANETLNAPPFVSKLINIFKFVN